METEKQEETTGRVEPDGSIPSRAVELACDLNELARLPGLTAEQVDAVFRVEGKATELANLLTSKTSGGATYPRTWWDVALERGVRREADGSISGSAFAEVGISILNCCPGCGATVGPHNSYQTSAEDPYAWCRDCVDGGASDEPVIPDARMDAKAAEVEERRFVSALRFFFDSGPAFVQQGETSKEALQRNLGTCDMAQLIMLERSAQALARRCGQEIDFRRVQRGG